MDPWSFELSSKMIFSRVLNSRFENGSLSVLLPLDMCSLYELLASLGLKGLIMSRAWGDCHGKLRRWWG